MTKPHLVIGASGQVGGHLLQVIQACGLPAIGTGNTHPFEGLYVLDIRSQAEVTTFVQRFDPAIIYLPASLTNVDYVESHPEEGYAVNVSGVRNVLQVANQVGSKLVYFSSDYVFDGKTGAYREDDTPNPLCVYGMQKLIAEAYIAQQAYDYLILRTNGVYGWEKQGKNFVYRLVEVLKSGQSIKVPSDQISTPTYAPELALAAFELVQKDKHGIYHIAGSEEVNRYAFAVHAASIFHLDSSLIEPVVTKQLNQTAARPLHGGLNTDKAQAELPFKISSYDKGLQTMFRKTNFI